MKLAFTSLLVPFLLAGCAFFDRGPGSVVEISSPAKPHSGQPNLALGPKGETYLSWIEVADTGTRTLKFATKTGDAWSEPSPIVEGSDLLLNWADFPSLFALENGAMAAHWLTTDASKGGYNIKISVSRDNGKTWAPPITPHRDGTPTEHGFVSLAPAPGGGVSVLWLDSRKLASAGSDDVSMMHTTVSVDGTPGAESEVDSRVCECCAPTSIAIAGGVLVAYRDRTADEIRDTAIVKLQGSEWSKPKIVFEDKWQIYACPINGPAIAASGDAVAVAWFTAANGKPRVQIAFSANQGDTFGPPVQVDDGDPIGRVDVVVLQSGAAVVTWIEHSSAGGQVRARIIDQDGTPRPSLLVGATSIGTASGFPRVERSGETAIFAWTDTDEHRVRTAALVRD